VVSKNVSVTVLISVLLYTPGDGIINCLKHVGIRSSFFSERVVNACNGLPTDVDFKTVTSFKRTILNGDLSSYR